METGVVQASSRLGWVARLSTMGGRSSSTRSAGWSDHSAAVVANDHQQYARGSFGGPHTTRTSRTSSRAGSVSTGYPLFSSVGAFFDAVLLKIRGSGRADGQTIKLFQKRKGSADSVRSFGAGDSGTSSADTSKQSDSFDIPLPRLLRGNGLDCATVKFQAFSFRLPETPAPRRRSSLGSITNSGNLKEPFVAPVGEAFEPARRGLQLDKQRNLFQVCSTKSAVFRRGAFELYVLAFENTRWVALTATKQNEDTDHFLIEATCKLWTLRRKTLLVEAVKSKALLLCVQLLEDDTRLIKPDEDAGANGGKIKLPWPESLPECPVLLPAVGTKLNSLGSVDEKRRGSSTGPGPMDSVLQQRRRSSTGLDRSALRPTLQQAEQMLLTTRSGSKGRR
ncbi:unnamed protein product [Amoebophrya sp. A120]|nr:unnamed protein product [Amoebophrya sp. A120]|eukprot:GSA120T00012717001.1